MKRNLTTFCLLFMIAVMGLSILTNAQVSVTATAGTLGPTSYTTLKASFDAINAGTHQGAIVISINGNTTETTTATLNASGSGASSYTLVNVKPATATTPTITGAISSGPVIKLNGASNITINGSNNATTSRDLTISNTSTSSSNVLVIGSSGTTPVHHDIVRNCNIVNGTQSSTAILVGDAATVGSPGYFNNITLQNNTVSKAYIGVYVYGVVATNNGNNTLVTDNDLSAAGANAIRLVGIYVQGADGATVSNNIIGNFESISAEFDRAIWFATATKNSSITGNTITGMAYTGTSSYAPIGLNISSGITNANITVSGNTISNMASSGTGTTMGIFSYSAMANVSINSNNIYNIKNTNTSGYGAAGILLAATITSTATKIYNNTISDVAAVGYNGYESTDNGNGIVVDGGGGYDIDFNSISMTQSSIIATAAHKSSALLVSLNASGLIKLRNNILSNSMTFGNANSRIALSNMAGTGVFTTINYNDYYSVSNNLSSTGTNASLTTSITALQTSLGGNANSINIAPIFSGINDLHIPYPNNVALNNTGTPIAGITTDMDAETRNATAPDIGADEIGCVPVSITQQPIAAVKCAGDTVMFVVHANNGTSYQWQQNVGSGFNNMTNSATYNGADNDTIFIYNVSTALNTSSYQCVVTYAIGCPTLTSSAVILTVNPSVVPAFSIPASICNGAAAPLLPTTSANSITGSWSPATVSNTTTATYTFTPNAGQCATSATANVTVNNMVTPVFNAIAPICSGATPPSLPTTSTNGVSGTWSPATIDNTASATYTFTPTAGQCATGTTLAVTVNPSVTPTFNAIAPICNGAIAPVLPATSTNGIAGTWSPATVSNITTATYTFTATGPGCFISATLAVTVNPNITPTFNAVPAICSGGTAPVLPATSTNGITGTWSPATVSNTATTTYTFTPTAVQCATTATLTVNVNNNTLPIFNAIAPICSGATAPVLPATSTNGITGTWSPATVSNTATATYTFTPNAGQCATTATLSVTVNPNITPTFTAIAPICSGSIAPVLPTTSNNSITGTWSPATVSNTTTATYTLTPTAGQCATTATLGVTVHPNITPTFTAIGPICNGTTAPVLPTTSINGITGTWSPATVSNTATGTYTFTPTAGQCATTATLSVTVNPNITPTFTAIAAICSGSAAPVLPTTSTNGITGTWSPATVSNTATTTYTFTPTAGQCATTATLTVTVTPNVIPAFSIITTLCNGTSAPVLLNTSTNGIAGIWSPATVSNIASGTYTFTPATGICALPLTVSVTVKNSVIHTDARTICTSQLPYTWNGIANANIGSVYATTAANGCDSIVTLQLTVLPPVVVSTINEEGCGVVFYHNQEYHNSIILRDTFRNYLGCDSFILISKIVVHPNNPYVIVVDTLACDQLYFEGSNYWSNTQLIDTFTSMYGCDSLIRIVNITIDKFVLNLSVSETLPYKGERIELVTTANDPHYSINYWTPAALFPDQHQIAYSIIANNDAVIVVQGMNENGCTDTATVSYHVQPLDYGVFVPNAFSPNGDGNNDVFGPRFYMKRAYIVKTLRIFNRWGQSVYNTANTINATWDGNNSNGTQADIGNYKYYMIVTFVDGDEKEFKGDLTLIR